MSAPGDDDPPPDQVLKPALVEDQDKIFPVTLGPTLEQLQQKAKADTLSGGDIAGYLAVEKAKAEMRGETRLSIPFEAVTFIANKLVGLKVWSDLENKGRKQKAQERNEELQDIANTLYDSAVDARTIAKDFLADPALHDRLQLWDPEEKAYKLMEEDTLRRIIAKRHERRK